MLTKIFTTYLQVAIERRIAASRATSLQTREPTEALPPDSSGPIRLEPRAAVYARTNHDPRAVDEYRRINRQIELCLSVAKEKGFAERAIDVYKDEGLSGIARFAPDLQKLLDHAFDYDAIIVPDISRLSRDNERITQISQQILDVGVVLWCCDTMGESTPNECVSGYAMLKELIDRGSVDHRPELHGNAPAGDAALWVPNHQIVTSRIEGEHGH